MTTATPTTAEYTFPNARLNTGEIITGVVTACDDVHIDVRWQGGVVEQYRRSNIPAGIVLK